MGSGILSIGITGIHAAQLGLEATQHNIANANTPGYSRQYIQQSAGIPRLTGSGYFGSGTTVDTVRRAYDKVLTGQSFAAQSAATQSDTYLAKISQVDNMLGDPTSGLSTALQDFFAGVQDVAANPSLVSARQSMISSAQAAVTRFNTMAGRLGELYAGVNSEISSEIQTINEYTKQIASMNDQITRAEAASNQPANDLLDARDQLVIELNKHVRVQTVEDSLGNFNVFAGNGQQLVVGGVANGLVVMASSVDPERIAVGLRGQSGSIQELAENQIDGGALGGLMSFRSSSLDGAMNSLGQIAASLALTFNAQNALGQDLEGLNQTSAAAGFQANFFTMAGPKVMATSSSAAVVTASFLPPSVNASGSFYTNLTGSDYVLRAGATSVTLTRSSDGTTWTAADITALNGQIASEGISLDGAAPTVGVNYLIKPTREAANSLQINAMVAGDPKRIAAAAPSVSSLGAGNTGSLKVSQGSVAAGYSLTNLPMTFSYSQTTATNGDFIFGFPPTGSVSATYADGTTDNITVASIPRLNGSSSELSKITYNGITVDVSGLPRNADSFTISANVNGVSDSRNAVKLAALQTQSTMSGGKASYQGVYASLVGEIGSTTSTVKVNSQAQAALLKQNESARASVSGVNLDEEAANLIRYQQAYQAAAKSLDVASKLFDTILAI
ncbi:MAG: flagellar hook-associated protein FlgK [Azonexus sp.]